MRRMMTIALALALAAGLALSPGCKQQMAQVETGEIVLCTEGHTVSDTVELREVPANEVAEHGVTTSVITCDLHTKLAALLNEAERALAMGDLDAAERALAEIAAQDSSYRNVGSQLAALRADDPDAPQPVDPTPAPDDGTSGDDAPDSGDPVVGPIANLIDYVPDRIPGFVGQSVISDPFVLFRDYLPESSGAIVQLAVEVEQFKDATQAQQMLDQVVRERFTIAGEDVAIGSLTGYVGTRPNYVRLGMTDRGILIMLEFYTTSSNPAEHKDTIIDAAKAIAGQ